MKKVRYVDTGQGITFKIEQDDGESLETLAVDLAEALNKKMLYEQQHSAFLNQSQNERRKAMERQTLLYQIKEYRKNKSLNPDTKVSRMEPMESYDPELIQNELDACIQNANDFHQESNRFQQLSKDEEKKIGSIQRKINEARRQAINDGAR